MSDAVDQDRSDAARRGHQRLTRFEQIVNGLAAAVTRLQARAERQLLDKPALLRKLNVSERWWRENGSTLVAAHGFPSPLPGLPGKWDPVAVDAWFDRVGGLPAGANGTGAALGALKATGGRPDDDLDARLEAAGAAIADSAASRGRAH